MVVVRAVLLAEEPFELVETVGPEALVEAEPLVRLRERSRFEAADMGAPAHLAADQTRALEHLDVLRRSRQRDRERLGELPDRAVAVGQLPQHPPPRGVAEGVEDGAEMHV